MGPGHGELPNVRVLVVDDDDDTRELLNELLAASGARVVAATSGRSAWRAFVAHSPEVVISDLQMPDGNGYELVRRIRMLPAHRGGLTPVIAVSAADGPELALPAGFHAHLAKPFGAGALIEVIRSFVRPPPVTRGTWKLVTSQPTQAMLVFSGHPTAEDMRQATRALAQVLEDGPRRVVVDLRAITGFDLSVGSIAERTTWAVRHRILGATIIGGSLLARLVARATCMALGVTCSCIEDTTFGRLAVSRSGSR